MIKKHKVFSILLVSCLTFSITGCIFSKDTPNEVANKGFFKTANSDSFYFKTSVSSEVNDETIKIDGDGYFINGKGISMDLVTNQNEQNTTTKFIHLENSNYLKILKNKTQEGTSGSFYKFDNDSLHFVSSKYSNWVKLFSANKTPISPLFVNNFSEDENLVFSSASNPKGVSQLLEYRVTKENLDSILFKISSNGIYEYLETTLKTDNSKKDVISEIFNASNDFFSDIDKKITISDVSTLVGVNRKGYVSYLKQTLHYETEKGKKNITFEFTFDKFNDDFESKFELPNNEETINITNKTPLQYLFKSKLERASELKHDISIFLAGVQSYSVESNFKEGISLQNLNLYFPDEFIFENNGKRTGISKKLDPWGKPYTLHIDNERGMFIINSEQIDTNGNNIFIAGYNEKNSNDYEVCTSGLTDENNKPADMKLDILTLSNEKSVFEFVSPGACGSYLK